MSDIEKYIDQTGFFMFQDTEGNYDWVVGVTPKITPLLHYKNEARKFQNVSMCIEGRGVTRSKAIRAAINKVRSVGRPVHKDVFWPEFK